MRAGWTPALEQRVRTVAPTAQVIIEARVEGAADVRQRADQWLLADGGLPANLEVLADGGLRLKATAGGAVGPTVHSSYYRSFEGGAAAPFIDPPSNQVKPDVRRELFAVVWHRRQRQLRAGSGLPQPALRCDEEQVRPKLGADTLGGRAVHEY